jgi:hypothetical protein
MRFNTGRFNTLLSTGGLGQNFLWRKADACPCFNPASGAAAPNCPMCIGKGWLWRDPLPAAAGVSGQKARMQYAQLGLWQAGDVVVSIPSDSAMYEIGQWDRVVFLNAALPFSLKLTRGAPDEILLYTAVATIDRVFWLNPAGNAIVEGGIPTVGADGSLTWPTGQQAPPVNQQYTITGSRQAEYWVPFDMAMNRNESGGLPLPKRILLRLFDVASR